MHLVYDESQKAICNALYRSAIGGNPLYQFTCSNCQVHTSLCHLILGGGICI